MWIVLPVVRWHVHFHQMLLRPCDVIGRIRTGIRHILATRLDRFLTFFQPAATKRLLFDVTYQDLNDH